MATQKVIYFTAGITATAPELAEIALLNAAAIPAYEVHVFNALASPQYGSGKAAADFVAGTPPVAYAAVTVIDPAALPFGIVSTSALNVKNSALSKTVAGTAILTGGNVDYVKLPATEAMVANTQQLTIPITGTYITKITLTVVLGVVTAGVLS